MGTQLTLDVFLGMAAASSDGTISAEEPLFAESSLAKPPISEPLSDRESLEALEALFKEAYVDMKGRRRAPGFEVEFYPYTTIKNVMWRADNTSGYKVRISDALRDAPRGVLKSLAYILLSKHSRKKFDGNLGKVYNEYVYTKRMEALQNELIRLRGRKRVCETKGLVRDLDESFDRVNRHYFNGGIKKPNLTWSKTPTYSNFGHQDDARNLIIISRSLDDKRIPEFVLDFVMYHEVLHITHGTLYKNGKRFVHTREFIEDERKFGKYKEAGDWLKRISARKIRR